MDDKDEYCIDQELDVTDVQIPLWTIRTIFRQLSKYLRLGGSDSSMDDKDAKCTGGLSVLDGGSDSSMDDKDYNSPKPPARGRGVQIPLWTIRTKTPIR